MENEHFEREAPAPAPQTGSPRSRKHFWIWVVVTIVAVYAIWSWTKPTTPAGGGMSRHGGGGRGGNGQATHVVASAVTKGDIGVVFKGLGTVTPLYSVTVTARVTGQLMQIFYKEGQMVKKGAPLAEIDPRPYQATLDQASGQLAHDQALLDNAQIDLQRYQTLWKQDSISQQILDTQKATVAQDQASIQADQGIVETDKLNVEYCHITSPIDGLVGLRLVDPGNQILTSGSTGLLVINQVQPITVVFPLPEDTLPAVLQQVHAGKTLHVDAYDREDKIKLAEGTLDSIDNQIDPATGTVKLRATFPNLDNNLYSNQFVNVHLLIDTKKDVTLAPPAALQLTTDPPFVYLVQKADSGGKKPEESGGLWASLMKFLHLDGTPAPADHQGANGGGQVQSVVVSSVTVGVTNADEAEIISGLAPGDVVVIDGVDKLQNNSPVIVQMSGSDAPSGSPTPAQHHHHGGSGYHGKAAGMNTSGGDSSQSQ